MINDEISVSFVEVILVTEASKNSVSNLNPSLHCPIVDAVVHLNMIVPLLAGHVIGKSESRLPPPGINEKL